MDPEDKNIKAKGQTIFCQNSGEKANAENIIKSQQSLANPLLGLEMHHPQEGGGCLPFAKI